RTSAPAPRSPTTTRRRRTGRSRRPPRRRSPDRSCRPSPAFRGEARRFPQVARPGAVGPAAGAVWLRVRERCVPIRSRSGTIFDEATMSSLLRSALPVLAACCLLALPRAGHAQAFGGGEYERALRPGAYVPYDGASFSHRYNYEYGPVLYLNQSP